MGGVAPALEGEELAVVGGLRAGDGDGVGPRVAVFRRDHVGIGPLRRMLRGLREAGKLGNLDHGDGGAEVGGIGHLHGDRVAGDRPRDAGQDVGEDGVLRALLGGEVHGVAHLGVIRRVGDHQLHGLREVHRARDLLPVNEEIISVPGVVQDGLQGREVRPHGEIEGDRTVFDLRGAALPVRGDDGEGQELGIGRAGLHLHPPGLGQVHAEAVARRVVPVVPGAGGPVAGGDGVDHLAAFQRTGLHGELRFPRGLYHRGGQGIVVRVLRQPEGDGAALRVHHAPAARDLIAHDLRLRDAVVFHVVDPVGGHHVQQQVQLAFFRGGDGLLRVDDQRV